MKRTTKKIIGEPYLRKKGSKWIIERKENGRTIYIMTLPPLSELIKAKRPDKASNSKQVNDPKSVERFAQQELKVTSDDDALEGDFDIPEEDLKILEGKGSSR